MYICKECKTEYKRKPQYCDCGNNTFETTHKEIVLDFSKIFLLFCILLSTIILIIPVKTNTNKTPESKKHNITKNIPTLDSFWDNTVAQKPITKTEKKVVQKTETMVTTPIAKSTPKQKTTKQTITKKTNTTNKTVTKKQNTNNTF